LDTLGGSSKMRLDPDNWRSLKELLGTRKAVKIFIRLCWFHNEKLKSEILLVCCASNTSGPQFREYKILRNDETQMIHFTTSFTEYTCSIAACLLHFDSLTYFSLKSCLLLVLLLSTFTVPNMHCTSLCVTGSDGIFWIVCQLISTVVFGTITPNMCHLSDVVHQDLTSITRFGLLGNCL